tara:strand:+ start:9809 stop:10195 length:387 start_codon:yes stop_codon:yes gene_type:complete
MELELKYTKEIEYEVEDSFMITLENANPFVAYKVAMYIEEHLPTIPNNDFHTHLMAGIIHDNNKPYPFVVECLKTADTPLIFTDLKFISLNEYLDFINLNSYIKSNDKSKSKQRNIYSGKNTGTRPTI